MRMRSGLLTAIAFGVAMFGCGSIKVDETDGGTNGPPDANLEGLTAVMVTPATRTVALGETVQYIATATLSDGSTADVTGEVDWSSSAEGVATIAADGLATSVGTGSATITATIMGVSDDAALTVGPPTLDSVEIAPASQTIQSGQFAAFTATAHYSNGPLDVTAQATWESENPAVAVPSTNPGEAGRFYAVSGGNTTVRATFTGVTGTAGLTVDLGPLGSEPANPGVDCMQIRDAGASIGTGLYWLDSDGDGEHSDAFQAYCDMTTDGGGWTLLGWTGNSAVQPYGAPYPGLAPCPTLDCIRGSSVGPPQAQELIQRSTEFAKGQQEAAIASFQPLGAYAYAGKYIYGSMSGLVLNYGPNDCAGAYTGWFRSIGGPADFDQRAVYLAQALTYNPSYGNYASDSAPYVWNVGTPNAFCDSSGAMPGTWMGTFDGAQYGPYLPIAIGASSVWVRGGSAPDPVGTQTNPGQSCRQIQLGSASNPTGVYWIAPGGSTPFQVYCDMTTAGGGWTLTYYVDADHFDGTYANNATSSTTAPLGINQLSDVWNAETFMPFTETLFSCTTQNDAGNFYWTYTAASNTTPATSPQIFLSGPDDFAYRDSTPSTSTNTTAANCLAVYKGGPGFSYGFMVLESATTCGQGNTMLFGMYHYNGGGGYLNNGTTPLTHNSPYDGRSIYYPICSGAQTTNGRFWVGVR